MWISGIVDSREAEVVSLCHALEWIVSMGYLAVFFETDAKLVVDALPKTEEDIFEFGIVIASCESILNMNRSYHVSFARRQTNKVAHALAKAICSYTIHKIWFLVPEFIATLLLDDFM
ncbi:hypothetical protein PTKIN_Ptkin10aG0175700 [Pterospermum kingtungense]